MPSRQLPDSMVLFLLMKVWKQCHLKRIASGWDTIQSTAATYPEKQAEQAVKALAAVQKVLDDKDTPEDISMDELLLKANVSYDI